MISRAARQGANPPPFFTVVTRLSSSAFEGLLPLRKKTFPKAG